jgi:ABC-type phosphate transport system substrate-binding protein
MFKKTTILFGVLMLAGTLLARPVAAQQFKVVVNAGADVSGMSSSNLSDIFQKKSRSLPGGEAAVPVDLPTSSPVREAFSQAVHGRGASAIEAWWQQQIFAGKDVPPETKDSDAAVLAFVAATPGAIGYVSAGAALVDGVKEVPVG